MDVAGEVVAQQGILETFEALTDPTWLASSVPGIRECEDVSDGTGDIRCRIVWELGIGVVRARFVGTVTWIKLSVPDRLALQVSGGGSLGDLDLHVEILLSREGEAVTHIHYQGTGEGPEPAPGWKSKALEPVAHFMIQKLVESLAASGGKR